MRNDNLAVDWLELNNFTDLVKTSPVMRSAELTETKELSKTPVFLYICVCVCVCCFGVFFLFQDKQQQQKSLPRWYLFFTS